MNIKSTILFFCAALFLLPGPSCSRSRKEMMAQHHTAAAFKAADSLCEAGFCQKAIPYLDSVYESLPYVSVRDSCRYYDYAADFYSKAHSRPAQISKSVEYTNNILRLIKSSGLTEDMSKEYAEAWLRKGNYCALLSQWKEAAGAYSMCRYISRKGGDYCTISDNTSSLALISFKQGEYTEAIDLFKEGLRQSDSCLSISGQFYRIQGLLDNLGLCYYNLSKIDSSIKYFRAAESYIIRNKQLYTLDTTFPNDAFRLVYGNMSDAFADAGSYDSAIAVLEQSAGLDSLHLRKNDAAESKTQIAQWYMDKGNLTRASQIINKIKPEDFGASGRQKMIWYSVMGKLCRLQNNVPARLRYLELCYALGDSLAQGSKAILSQDPSLIYGELEKKHQVDGLEDKYRVQRIYSKAAAAGGLLFILLCAIIFLGLRRSKKDIAKMKVLNNALRQREFELKVLMEEKAKQREKELLNQLQLQEMQLQMEHNDAISAQRANISDDMHDELSSSLAALKFYVEDMAGRQSDEKMKKIFAGLTEEVLFIYISAREYMHSLRENIRGTKYDLAYFLDDTARKFKEKGLLSVNAEFDRDALKESLSPAQHDQLYHIIRECISNVIKHAAATAIHIKISTTGGVCTFSVSDNGKGFNESLAEKGIGLGSMRARIKEIKGTLNITSSGDGTLTQGTFPLN